MISPAQKFIDKQWPDEWPEYDEGGKVFYDTALKEWEEEYNDAVWERWTEFRDETTRLMKQKAATT